MATWLLLAVGAQFIAAVSVLIDRHIVVKATHIGKPIVYAFFVSVMSGFVVVLLPFGVTIPSTTLLILATANAAAFIVAIYFLYTALLSARASDVAPVVGAISSIATLIFAHFWIDGDVSAQIVPPVILLALGTALISRFHFTRQAFFLALISGVAFGGTAFLAKLVFLETTFLDGFFWTRMMNVALACSFLLIPSVRHAIFSGGKHSSHRAKVLVIGNKILAGCAAILTAIAISLGSVSVVNALSGLQFAFLFVFAALFARYMPVFRDGHTHGHGGWQTGLGVAIIGSGLALLAMSHAI